MRKLILCALCLFPIGLMAQSYTLKGKVGNLNAPAKAYLVFYEAAKLIVADSVELKNGSFEFKGAVKNPISAYIRVKHVATPSDAKNKMPNDALYFYLENTTIKIDATDSIKYAKITGSKINDDNAKLNDAIKPYRDRITNLTTEYRTYTADQKKDKAFMKLYTDRYNVVVAEKAVATKKFAMQNTNSFIGFTAYKSGLGSKIDPAVVEPEFMKFSAELRDSEDGKRIEGLISGAKKMQIGVLTDFTQNDPNGKPVKLSDFKGKYVLVDFWASWCGPCRAENPQVVSAFNNFKNKNFTIVSVSLDGGTTKTTKEAWLKAIADDKLDWTHVSDLKGGENEVAKAFGITSIPTNFLVDPRGKIIAKNLRGEKLQTTLAEIIDGNAK